MSDDPFGRTEQGWPIPPPWRPTWVDLPALFARPDGANKRVLDGVDVSDRAMGIVRQWIRADGGLWLGQCTYRIPYLDGRPGRLEAVDQWLPATVLTPRTEHTDRGW
jgi:hypothetical protein